MKITIFSPSGVILEKRRLQLATKRLEALGAAVQVDESASLRFLRFAGSDEARLEAIHRAATDNAQIALASRGGYGLTRLLDRIDWALIAKSVQQGKYWIGHSDFTAFSLALLAHTHAPSWAGPMALSDFGRVDAAVVKLPAIDKFTSDCFLQAMQGKLESVAFQTEEGFDALKTRGMLWGGNLTILCSLLGTPHMPDIKDGILFLEDVNERPYCVERMLLQLHQAGVLQQQKAILLGDFGSWPPSAIDRDYRFKDVIECIRSVCNKPILTGLPFGHTYTKLTLPVGVIADLTVQGQTSTIAWGASGFEVAVQNATQTIQEGKTLTADESRLTKSKA